MWLISVMYLQLLDLLSIFHHNTPSLVMLTRTYSSEEAGAQERKWDGSRRIKLGARNLYRMGTVYTISWYLGYRRTINLLCLYA